MTENRFPLAGGSSDDSHAVDPSHRSSGVQRRTIVQGAAWTIPVVATAVGAPLAAASTTELTLTFVDGPYEAIACGPLDDITVHAANGATPAAGAPITVTLPAGLTWSDGTTTPRTLPADASGNIVLSGVRAPNRNGTFNLVATSGTATAASSVTVQGADRGVISQFGGNPLPALPAGVRVEDIQTNSSPTGAIYTIVRGSDGNAYTSSLAPGATKWAAWSKSGSPLAGTITDVAISKQGLTNIVANDTTISQLGGNVSTPLPGGATIKDVQSYSLSSPPSAVAVVLGSDGRAYSNTTRDGGWTGWVPTALPGAIDIAVSETGGGAVVASSTRVARVGGGAASPVLPNGATITDVITSVNSNTGGFGVTVLGSDGRAYNASFDPTKGTWTPWGTAANSPLNGSIQHIAQSKSTGMNVFVGSTNRVSLFGGAGGSTPPLPNGATIAAMEGVTNTNGVPSVLVLGSDGRAYTSALRNGAWSPWQVSRVAQGKLEHISYPEAGGFALVASNPTC